MEMKELKLQNITVIVCEECFNGNHRNVNGLDHTKGPKGRRDCKNTGMLRRKLVQCQCTPDCRELWKHLSKRKRKIRCNNGKEKRVRSNPKFVHKKFKKNNHKRF